MLIPFWLLGLSICAAWFPFELSGQKIKLPLWALLFACALTSGLIFNYLSLSALVSFTILIALSYTSQYLIIVRWKKLALEVVLTLLLIGFFLHLIPGFYNPVLFSKVILSAEAAPFSLYANFDKAAAGLVLLVFFCQRSTSWQESKVVLIRTLPIAFVTVFGLILTALVLNYVKLDFKFSWVTIVFLTVNLVFTCVAEEAFFRGFIQTRLHQLFSSTKFCSYLTVLCSGLLFGVAHLAGGIIYVGVATLAGLGYAYAYFVTQRIEAPILTHFALNAMHFVGFTYPYLQHS